MWRIVLFGLMIHGSLSAEERYVEKAALDSPHATQAAAADERFVYAVSNRTIMKYDRSGSAGISMSEGPASHLNSAVISNGKVLCAHSNYPKKPEQGDIRMLDPETMELTIFHSFENPPGSLTWALEKDGFWWCHFAHYGAENAKSVLIKFDQEWKEVSRWLYPEAFVKEWGRASVSGAVWQGDHLLVTGHDKKEIYRLKVGKTIEWVGTIPSPFPGQGIAVDLKTGGLVGIDRKRKAVLFAELENK
jgi:hypothetical protein